MRSRIEDPEDTTIFSQQTATDRLLSDQNEDDFDPGHKQDYFRIFQQFSWMGWSAFGGPSAHIGLFQKVLVENLQWLTPTLFLELLALCQLMPGPTSTQMSFVIGITQQGVTGGLLSGLLFQLPGLLLASACGIGAANFLKDPAPWLRCVTSGGLAAVGVALVASAAKSLTHSTCKNKITLAVNATTATIVSASVFILEGTQYGTYKAFHWWGTFFKIGSLIFGGGQVVLPMLDSAVVEPGWISESDFLTGIALVQAMPGPLFNIAAYVGAIIAANANMNGLTGIMTCWVGLFAPGILLIYGLLPWWARFRQLDIYRRALPGVNAAAVGLIVAAVFQLGLKVHANSPFPTATVSIGIVGFALVDALDVPPALVVLVGAVLGLAGWVCNLH
ncbi:hypothetical protein WJX79_008119 [Trebouxia sp. C0005]